MISKILITLGVIVFTVVIPVLEINSSHVFNPNWPPHARLHEVWQLSTHCALGVFCLWLAWFKQNISIAGTITMIVMGGVLFAHLIEDSYGGSILSGNTSTTVLGFEVAAFAATLVVFMSVTAMILDKRAQHIMN